MQGMHNNLSGVSHRQCRLNADPREGKDRGYLNGGGAVLAIQCRLHLAERATQLAYRGSVARGLLVHAAAFGRAPVRGIAARVLAVHLPERRHALRCQQEHGHGQGKEAKHTHDRDNVKTSACRDNGQQARFLGMLG